MAPAGLNMTKKRKCCTKNFPVIVLFASNHIAVVACSFSYLSVNTCLLLAEQQANGLLSPLAGPAVWTHKFVNATTRE